ncbi:MAG: hypothetical protein KAH57_02745 [Thermoplasmata archaeon]|nr:hypothetical protein [Thermoplasmata archaeon]
MEGNVRGTTVLMVYSRTYGDALFSVGLLVSISLLLLFWILYIPAILVGAVEFSFVVLTFSAMVLALMLIPILLFIANNLYSFRRV